MSAYSFSQIPKLKKALAEGNLQLALGLVPMVDAEEDKYSYLTLMSEIEKIFLVFYRDGNQLALHTTIHLVANSDRLYFVEDWPQFTDLIANLVGAIAEMDTTEARNEMLKAVLTKLPLRNRYVINDSKLNYNLACFYALNEEVKQMMEYVRRARFSYEPETFINDESFAKYKDENFFRDSLENIGYTMFTWWNCLWPIEEWCEDF